MYKNNVVSMSSNINFLHLSLYFAKDLFILLFPKVLDPIIIQSRPYHIYACRLCNQRENIHSFSQVSMIMHLFKYRWRKTYVC